MVKWTAAELRAIMDKKDNIRNSSVIAHADHGRSTFTNTLVEAAQTIAQEVASDVRMTGTPADKAEGEKVVASPPPQSGSHTPTEDLK
ncbi:elongation factor 2-like [Triticum dicoccoides]|uniref:elongation factor 2-like n=1 Tax=Triticum dicoccoides TaxID=85692 RepID=UPI000843615C|nr:elongation factor 2-like [Triticum dicoccoides]XP_037424695.1 elongation factor 2-like [Triticum dicoccoides]XP_044360978.1 elongation factor 2-like [Triticum aestivum]XP_044360979.1 elongation factor 2-like [Triticum aestivum]